MQLGKCRVKDKYLVVYNVIVSETTSLWIYLILLVEFFLDEEDDIGSAIITKY